MMRAFSVVWMFLKYLIAIVILVGSQSITTTSFQTIVMLGLLLIYFLVHMAYLDLFNKHLEKVIDDERKFIFLVGRSYNISTSQIYEDEFEISNNDFSDESLESPLDEVNYLKMKLQEAINDQEKQLPIIGINILFDIILSLIAAGLIIKTVLF